MSDDDSIFWFLAGCFVGDPTERLNPRDKWDVVVYVVAVVVFAVVIVFVL